MAKQKDPEAKASTDGAGPAPETDTTVEPKEVVREVVVEKVVYVDRPAPAPSLPRQMRVERFGEEQAPLTVAWPQIRGGICEFCGVLDPNTPSQYQYKLCNHYRGMQVRCSYCPPQKDPNDVVYHSKVNVYEDPYNRGTIIFQCDSSECVNKHYKRFRTAGA